MSLGGNPILKRNEVFKKATLTLNPWTVYYFKFRFNCFALVGTDECHFSIFVFERRPIFTVKHSFWSVKKRIIEILIFAKTSQYLLVQTSTNKYSL